jgi:opacity protein-like surface antigen
MIKFVATLIVAFVLGGTAMAQTTPPTSAASATSLNGVYVGAGAGYGGTHWNSGQFNNSLKVGYQFNQNFAMEGYFDMAYRGDHHATRESAFVNAVVGTHVGRVAPYALLGTGYGFNWSVRNGDVQPLWNVGAGVKYDLRDGYYLDTRYRYVAEYAGHRVGENIVSVGVGYRF